MTICLAALCIADESDGEAGPTAVVAADRMVTLGGFIEFEHAIPKMAHPSNSGIVMIAGDTLTGTRMAQDVADSFAGSTPKIDEIARAMATRYGEVRTQRVTNQVLLPRGLDMATYYGSHASLNPQITMMIDQNMAQWNLGVELLLAGVDADGAHIFSIQNPGGEETRHDVIGYSAIGSGTIHALQAFIGFGHHSGASLKETVFRAYVAKRRAEVAPGVGHDSDLAIVSRSRVTFLTKDQFKTLAQTYETYEDSTRSALTTHLEGLNLNLASGEPDDTANN